MSVRLLPYLAFPGNGSEVLAHYNEIFGGSLSAGTYGDMDMDLPFSPPPDALAHGRLDAGDVQLAGGDAIDGSNCSSTQHSFLLECDSVDEATDLIDRFLGAGATEAMPFELAPWGDHYGQVTDRYGALWAFVVPAGG